MVSQTVDRILSSEKAAQEKIESAKKQAEEMVVSATKQAKVMVENSITEAKNEAERRSQANQVEIEALLSAARKASLQEVGELRAKAESKVDQATHTVIEFIMNRNS